MARNKKHVAVGLSGGVDSAVTAALLKNQGHEVIGVHLLCYDEGPWCTANEDRASAVRVAKHLGIPLMIWDLRREYKDKVISYFFDEYRAGRTPNPDIVCNREIKFGIFLDRALEDLGVAFVATGHYARVAREARGVEHTANSEWQNRDKNSSLSADSNSSKPNAIRHKLLAGLDETKDQSYFLYTLTQKQLEYILFPIGDYRKEEVRKLAKSLGLPNAARPDSQGICFVGPVNVSEFLHETLPVKIGAVVNTRGETIGEHEGVWFYTEGQRHGFKVFKPGLPLYVVRKELESNTLVVGRGQESEVKEFIVEKPHLINQNYKSRVFGKNLSLRSGTLSPRKLSDKNPSPSAQEPSPASRDENLRVRIRHLGELFPTKVSFRAGNKDLLVSLRGSAQGVAPGQSAVFYQDEEVLGGGVIREARPLTFGEEEAKLVLAMREETD